MFKNLLPGPLQAGCGEHGYMYTEQVTCSIYSFSPQGTQDVDLGSSSLHITAREPETHTAETSYDHLVAMVHDYQHLGPVFPPHIISLSC